MAPKRTAPSSRSAPATNRTRLAYDKLRASKLTPPQKQVVDKAASAGLMPHLVLG